MKLKLSLLLITLILIAFCISAEDIIVLNNGDIIKANVLEIGVTEIKYKKISNPNGPIYNLLKSEVLSINFDNGEKETFEANDKLLNNANHTEVASFVPAKASENNLKILDRYNNLKIRHKNKKPDRENPRNSTSAILHYGITPNSIMDDGNVELIIEKSLQYTTYNNGFEVFNYDFYSGSYIPNYKIKIKNNTTSTVFIDLANSFRILTNGNAESFYNGTTITRNSGTGSNIGLNLGSITNVLGIGGILGTLSSGIGIGGGRNSSVSVTESENPIISIPPEGIVTLPQKMIVIGKQNKIIKNYEIFSIVLPEIFNGVRKWDYIEFELEDNKPIQSYYITYSTDPNFKNYSAVYFGLFAKGILGGSAKIKDILPSNALISSPFKCKNE